MDFHGAPMLKTWVKLAESASEGSTNLVLEDAVDWDIGAHIIVTRSRKPPGSFTSFGSYRTNGIIETEERYVAGIDGTELTVDAPLMFSHPRTEGYTGEVAILSRNVIVESKDPGGVRGHTMFHHESLGGISYAEFAHLGKEGTLGRYPIHYHVVGPSMRGTSVVGASIWDSHNRFITIHGTDYLLVRDCVGYKSVGHGFYMENASEVYNFLDHNLAVLTYEGSPLPNQPLSYDENEGSGFWWANGRNSFRNNVATECDKYGYKFDIPSDIYASVLQPDGTIEPSVQVNRLPFILFRGNETHGTLNYGIQCNGDAPPDDPFVIDDLSIWECWYAVSADVNNFLITDLDVWHVSYGYRSNNPGNGKMVGITIRDIFDFSLAFLGAPEGLITIEDAVIDSAGEWPFRIIGRADRPDPCDIHIRDYTVENIHNNFSGAAAHPLTLSEPELTLYLHDWFGPGRDAKVIPTVQTRDDSLEYFTLYPTFSYDVKVAETDVPFPQSPITQIDRLPPSTVILYPQSHQVLPLQTDSIEVLGTCIDASTIVSVVVNGINATPIDDNYGSWRATLRGLTPGAYTIESIALDEFGNVELNPHRVTIGIGEVPLSVIGPVALDPPFEFRVSQNYPNPFNPKTMLQFEVPAPLSLPGHQAEGGSHLSPVNVTIYDLLGREIAILVNEKLAPGTYTREWDATGFPSGVYLCRVTMSDRILSSKMILAK